MNTDTQIHGSRNDFLNVNALREHGTFEWRHLEGVEDPVKIKAWITLIMRFIQACNSDAWNTRFVKLPVLKADANSIRAFLKFLDLNRKGLSDELKDAKEWYMDRAKVYSESGVYKKNLHAGVCIKTLRNSEIIPDLGKFIAAATDESDGFTDQELGSRFNRAVLGVMSHHTWHTSHDDAFAAVLDNALTREFGVDFAAAYRTGDYEQVGARVRIETDNFIQRFTTMILRLIYPGETIHSSTSTIAIRTVTSQLSEEEQCVVL